MSLDDAAKIWSLNYQVLLSVIVSVESDITALGVDSKELLLLAEIDEHPYPAELATTLSMPKPTVTVYLKRLEAAGFVRRVGQPKTASRSHRTRSASVLNASPEHDKGNSRSCSNKFSDFPRDHWSIAPTRSGNERARIHVESAGDRRDLTGGAAQVVRPAAFIRSRSAITTVLPPVAASALVCPR
jgi:hypothetical protein